MRWRTEQKLKGNRVLLQPCPGDPINNLRIAPSYAGNYRGGTWGYTRNRGKQFHDGIDIAATLGTALIAAHARVVTRVETNFTSGQYAENSYGNFVEIKSTITGAHFI